MDAERHADHIGSQGDGHGRPLPVLLTAGNVNDCTMFTQVIAGIRMLRRRDGPLSCQGWLDLVTTLMWL